MAAVAEAERRSVAASSTFSWPRKRATNSLPGSRHTSAAMPSRSTRPARITTRRSPIAYASSWSWVTWIADCPSSRSTSRSSTASRSRSAAVERAERLVEHQQARARARAPERARRAGLRRPRACRLRGRRIPRARRAGAASCARSPLHVGRQTLHPQPERDVLAHVAMREQRVVLEHEAEPALVRRVTRDVVAVPRARARGRAPPGRRSTRSSVVLPQPLGPTTRDDLAGRDRRATRRRARRWRRSATPQRASVRSPASLTSRARPRAGAVRSTSTLAAVSAASTTPSAIACPRQRRARLTEQPEHRDGHRRRVGAGEERRRAELPERDREGERGADEQRAARDGQIDLAAGPAAATAPSTVAASRRRGSMARSAGTIDRSTNGTPTSAWAIGHDRPTRCAGRAVGRRARSECRSPSVTALVPSGTISARSSTRPPRRP